MAFQQETSQLSQAPSLPLPGWFSALAANYAKQTGDSTRRVFESCFDDIQAITPITKDSVIHDNAGGPGTASSVVVGKVAKDELPQILITDNVPAMIQAAKDSFSAWPTIEARVLDSVHLEGIPDEHFSHNFLNFSIFLFSSPADGLREIYRTLKLGGLAFLTTWKRFGAIEVIHAAQKMIRPDLPLMKLPRPEFFQDGHLYQLTIDAGFNKSNVHQSERTVIVQGPELEEGLKNFFLSDFTGPARVGWTEEEVARWPEAINAAIQTEINAFGGIKFEAYVVLAQK